jgi:hypothetical protein
MINTLTPYQFVFKSNEPAIDFSSMSQKQFSRVLYEEDIFDIYPYLEVHTNDQAGVLVDTIISAEGLEFTSKFGSNVSGYEGWVENEWVWRDNWTEDIEIKDGLGGMIGMGFVHKYHALDDQTIRAWEDTISNIVKDILRKDYNFTDTSKMYIADTTGTRKWYQNGVTNEKFLETLSKRAYSPVYENNPYITFFNYLGEFYFCPIHYLWSIGKRVSQEPYLIKAEESSSYDNLTFKKIDNITILGMTYNKPNYKSKIHKFKDSSFDDETTDIINHIINNGSKGKLLINKRLKASKDYYSLNDYGLYHQATDFEDYKGYKNSLYRKNLFNFRMTGIVPYNKDIAIGRIIPIDAGSYISNKNSKSKEYSGDWLIYENKLFFDYDGVPYNVISVGKNEMILDSSHPLKNTTE